MSLQQALELAVGHHQSGRLTEAEALYRQIIVAQPDHRETMQRLAILAQQSGRGAEAVELLRRAAALSPDAADVHANLGAVLASQGNVEAAVEVLARAASLRPDLPVLHLNLANAQRESGRLDAAAGSYHRALALNPNHPPAWNLLGATLQGLDRPDEARDAFERSIKLDPNRPDAHNNLAGLLHRRGEIEQAVDEYRRAIEIAPDLPEPRANLIAALLEIGRTEEALAEARAALSVRPDEPALHFALAGALRQTGDGAQAVEAYRRAIALRPDYPEALVNLGGCLRDMGRLDESVAAYRSAISLRPVYGEAYAHLAAALRDAGELDESIECHRKAGDLTANPSVAGNLLYTIHFHPDYDAKRIFEEHLAWNQRYAREVEEVAIRNAIRNAAPADRTAPRRRLRIGYVSCDFRYHPVGRFMLPIVEHHDADRFEIVCYSDTLKPDATTESFKRHAHAWRKTLGVSDARLAELVRDDRIDILFDLTLHARTGRMMAFARKPAPVQVSYLAYCSTSGLRTMDYRLSDPYLDPPGGDESVYFEKTVRLPQTYWCYPPSTLAPPVAPLPALSNDYVTFGCLNIFAKVNPVVLKTWGRILHSVPRSRLLLHAPEGRHRDRARGLLAHAGADPGRVEFVGFMPGASYFDAYHRIDVALDPFPYAGGTTTCDALWMGVPVVSLAGSTAVSRAGLSILSNLGMADCVARGPDEYVHLATQVARDVDALATLRQGLRERMTRSPLLDAATFTRGFEAALMRMWDAQDQGNTPALP